MILATLDQALQYSACHPGLRRGFEFLHDASLATIPDGKHEIDGQRLFAICAHDQGRGRDGAVLEYHRKYIDIQYVVSGEEIIGWRPFTSCRQTRQAYDSDRDCGLFEDPSQSWFEVPPGSFAIFFPEDAHAPLAGSGLVHKVVIKVAVANFPSFNG